ncbi:hypothetical protein BCR33DRAFT_734306 [Rhizoclosmatium globosum]|uniref:Transcription factor domain-containing protein n=1 Tax=Rhizoclosmatium globosum TaxID=329046 RepID=A0A1Y2CTZ2_9FUNG|nr:hypothetical protein BCR33DRAFT_734306 [Rhizoclosmatium globosum]|eukprot:ORY50304.1 hypothetical protein BCR33DRAFT_734306 [Rhizoclosmatium globosum]
MHILTDQLKKSHRSRNQKSGTNVQLNKLDSAAQIALRKTKLFVILFGGSGHESVRRKHGTQSMGFKRRRSDETGSGGGGVRDARLRAIQQHHHDDSDFSDDSDDIDTASHSNSFSFNAATFDPNASGSGSGSGPSNQSNKTTNANASRAPVIRVERSAQSARAMCQTEEGSGRDPPWPFCSGSGSLANPAAIPPTSHTNTALSSPLNTSLDTRLAVVESVLSKIVPNCLSDESVRNAIEPLYFHRRPDRGVVTPQQLESTQLNQPVPTNSVQYTAVHTRNIGGVTPSPSSLAVVSPAPIKTPVGPEPFKLNRPHLSYLNNTMHLQHKSRQNPRNLTFWGSTSALGGTANKAHIYKSIPRFQNGVLQSHKPPVHQNAIGSKPNSINGSATNTPQPAGSTPTIHQQSMETEEGETLSFHDLIPLPHDLVDHILKNFWEQFHPQFPLLEKSCPIVRRFILIPTDEFKDHDVVLRKLCASFKKIVFEYFEIADIFVIQSLLMMVLAGGMQRGSRYTGFWSYMGMAVRMSHELGCIEVSLNLVFNIHGSTRFMTMIGMQITRSNVPEMATLKQHIDLAQILASILRFANRAREVDTEAVIKSIDIRLRGWWNALDPDWRNLVFPERWNSKASMALMYHGSVILFHRMAFNRIDQQACLDSANAISTLLSRFEKPLGRTSVSLYSLLHLLRHAFLYRPHFQMLLTSNIAGTSGSNSERLVRLCKEGSAIAAAVAGMNDLAGVGEGAGAGSGAGVAPAREVKTEGSGASVVVGGFHPSESVGLGSWPSGGFFNEALARTTSPSLSGTNPIMQATASMMPHQDSRKWRRRHGFHLGWVESFRLGRTRWTRQRRFLDLAGTQQPIPSSQQFSPSNHPLMQPASPSIQQHPLMQPPPQIQGGQRMTSLQVSQQQQHQGQFFGGTNQMSYTSGPSQLQTQFQQPQYSQQQQHAQHQQQQQHNSKCCQMDIQYRLRIWGMRLGIYRMEVVRRSFGRKIRDGVYTMFFSHYDIYG